MKRLFLITLLVLSSGPAYAEWVEVATSVEDETIYIDPETIRRKGDLVEVGVLFDSRVGKHLQDGSHYLSTRELQQYDCAEERSRLLAVTLFSGNMGKGPVLDDLAKEGPWRPIPPNSVGRRLMELICAK